MKKLLCIFASFILLAQQCRTDIILAWDVSGDTSPTTLTAETIIAGVATTAGLNTLSRASGLGNPGTVNSFAGNGWNLTDTFGESDDYFSLTVQANSAGPGNNLTLTTLQYTMNGSASAPNNGRWGYSIGGGAFTLQSSFVIPGTLPGALATWDFGDFTTTQSVEFRFWAFGAGNIGAGGASAAAGSVRVGNIAGNNLVLNGTVAQIPEPGSLAMLALGALGLLVFSRRRRA